MTAFRLQALRAGDDVLLDGELHTVQAVSATSARLANVVGVVWGVGKTAVIRYTRLRWSWSVGCLQAD